MVAGKIGDKWKAIEEFWFSLLESKIQRILRFEFLYVCLCESFVFLRWVRIIFVIFRLYE